MTISHVFLLALAIVSEPPGSTSGCKCDPTDHAGRHWVPPVEIGDALADVVHRLGPPDWTACRGASVYFDVLRVLPLRPQVREAVTGAERFLVYLRQRDEHVIYFDANKRVVWTWKSTPMIFNEMQAPVSRVPWMPADGDCSLKPQVVEGPALAPECASTGGAPIERVLSHEPMPEAVALWRKILLQGDKKGEAARAELGALYCREGYLEAGRLLSVPASARYRADWPGTTNTIWIDPPSTGGADRRGESGWSAVEAEAARLVEARKRKRTLRLVESWVERQAPATTHACWWAYAALQRVKWGPADLLSTEEWETMYRVGMTCLAETDVLATYLPGRLDGYGHLANALAWEKQWRLEDGVRHRALAEPAHRVVAPNEQARTREEFLESTSWLDGEDPPVPTSEAIHEPVVDQRPPE